MEPELDLDELAEELLRVLARLALNQRRGFTGSVASGNLTLAQLSILFALLAEGPIRMNELAAHERVRNPTATVAVHRLEKLGLVQRSRDVFDMRAVLVAVTPRGAAEFRASLTSRRTALAAMLSELCESDLEMLSKALAPLKRIVGDAVSHTGAGPDHRRRFGRGPNPG